MPLNHSGGKAAFSSNVSAEVNAGKKPSQAVAIAYSVAKRALPKNSKSLADIARAK